MKKWPLACAVVALLLATRGAAASRDVTAGGSAGIAPPIDLAGYARYANDGSGRLRGVLQANFRIGPGTVEGAAITCAPDLPYERWVQRTSAAAFDDVAVVTPRYPAVLRRFRRSVNSGVGGRFAFENLPSGNYICTAALRIFAVTKRYVSHRPYRANEPSSSKETYVDSALLFAEATVRDERPAFVNSFAIARETSGHYFRR